MPDESPSLTIISANCHVVEPPSIFEGRLPSDLAARAPHIVETDDGFLVWQYEQFQRRLGLQYAAVAQPPQRWADLRIRFEEMAPGFYDGRARIKAMDEDDIYASVVYPLPLTGFGGELLYKAIPDPQLSLACVRAWNDWYIEEFVGSDTDRLIPLQLPYYHDPRVAADEIHRNAERGFKAVTLANPSEHGLPSILTDHWDPFLHACVETDTVVGIHTPQASFWPIAPEAPYGLKSSLFQSNAIEIVAEWTWAGIALRFPELRLTLAESGGTWLPHLLERLQFARTYSPLHAKDWPAPDLTPAELVRRTFVFSTLEVDTARELGEAYGFDRWMLESDYPHPESVWPHSQEHYREALAGCSADFVRSISWETASRLFRHPVPEQLQLPQKQPER
jgi:predicted TIM-barrel fold metal-dependent hydrolase